MALVAAFVGCALLMPPSIWLLRRLGLWDVPNRRSSHTSAIARGGGLPVLVVAATVTCLLSSWEKELGALLLGTGTLGFVGFMDDLLGLRAAPRLATQVATPLVASLAIIDRSGPALVLGLAVAVAWCAAYVNAFNFMDGINGISGTQAAINGVFLALIAREFEHDALWVASLALTGAVLGFLPFNAFHPKVFLGDVGSYAIGFWLASSSLLLWDLRAPPLVLLGPFLLYLADTASTLMRRWKRRSALFEAHREHTYQRLTQLGWSHIMVTLVCAAFTTATSAIMFAARDSQTTIQVLALAAAIVVISAYIALPGLLAARR